MFLLKYYIVFAFLFCIAYQPVYAQPVTAAFDVNEVVCIDEPLTIKNTSTGGSTYEWNFCAIDLKKPRTEELPLTGILDEPVYMDVVYFNSKYYAFVVNYKSGDLVRLDFGDNLLNAPTAHNFGNFNNVIPSNSGSGGIQVVQNEGKWYAIIVAGYPPGGSNPRILKISFGETLENLSPTATDWGNIGNMYDPKDFVLLQENGVWYGFTVNSENSTITRFNFTGSFENTPTATNLGNFGVLNYPTGIYVVEDGGVTRMYITNSGDDTRINGYYKVVRFDFITLLDETPDIADVGNVGNLLQSPRDIHILTLCDNIYGLVLNAHPNYNTFLHLNFLGSYTNHPNGSINLTNHLFDYPYSFSDFTTIDEQIIGFVVNKGNNSITRVVFSDCGNSSILKSNSKEPPEVTYNSPGIYTIRLTVNKGMENEASYCRQIVTQDCHQEVTVTDDTTICANTPVRLEASTGVSYTWSPATYLDNANSRTPLSRPAATTKYYVDVMMPDNSVYRDSITITIIASPTVTVTADTSICVGSAVQLFATGGGNYEWLPADGLNNAASPNPVATPASDVQYKVRVTGENACVSEESVNVTVRPYPQFSASGSPSVCQGQPVTLTASGGENYSWTPAELVENPNAALTSAIPKSSTTFQVNISESVCHHDTTIAVPVRLYTDPESNAFTLPNAFTPNGDGRNDCFGLNHWGDLQVEQFTIFNRWGQTVFQSSHTTDCWDGNLKNALQPSGTYLYVIRANTPCGFVTRKGMVTLIR